MMLKFDRKFPWIRFRDEAADAIGAAADGIAKESKEPLREFIYLDEVSLASLLASQKGEITENTTSQIESMHEVENSTKFGFSAPSLASIEASKRFQTTNSTALQTVRKANAQSLFRELHKLEHLRKIKPTTAKPDEASFEDLFNRSGNNLIFKTDELKRGDLVEFRVKLSVPLIFKISTLMSELSEIMDESPSLFMNNSGFLQIYNARDAIKVINRLLAGLVPIDGFVTDYSVTCQNGIEYVAHNSAIARYNLDSCPLKIVGVTEHLAYWKDIRRILFAESEFTVLCRLAKTGLQTDWNPIKGADIFGEFAPDLAKQIEASSRAALMQSSRVSEETKTDSQSQKLMEALLLYKDLLIDKLDQSISVGDSLEIDKSISSLQLISESAEGQRSAFSQTRSIVERLLGVTIEPKADLELRERVRATLDLNLFSQSSDSQQSTHNPEPIEIGSSDSRMLDVEVVAIYW